MTWQTDICGKSKPGVWQDGYLQPCFEDVIVFGLLFLYIIVFGSYRIYQLSKVPKSLEGRMRFWAHSTKIVCHSIVAFVPWLALILRFFSEYSADTYQLFYYFGLSVTFCFSLVITEIEFSRRTLHNWVLMSWWTLSFICSAIKLQTMVAQLHVDESMYFELPLFVVGFIAILILACFGLFYNHIPGVEEDSYRKLSEDEQERLNSTISINSYESNAISRHNLDRMSRSEVLEYHERNRPDSLEESANIFSKLLFSWLSPILATGFERVLEDSDLPKLIRVDTAVVNGALFRHEWQKELELRPDNPSIAKVLGRSYLPQFISSGVLKLFQDILQFVGPVCLNLIVAFISNPLAHPAEGYTLVIALVLCSIIQTVSAQTYFNIVYRISIQIRGALVTAIYRKGFKLSADSRQKSTVGEFVNNMSIDTQRICDLIPYIHLVWSAPLQVIVCLGMLFFLLGWSVISGITLMIVMIPINGIIMRKLTALQKLIMKSKDERVRSMNELLQGIRLIKFFAWERSFEDKITGIRDAELKNLKTAAYYRAIITFFWMSTPLFVSIVTFTTFALAGNLLTPEIAFTSLALFNILRFPLNMLPTVISSLVEAKVSSKRLHTLFLSSEMDPNIVAHYEPSPHAPSVLIRNGTFSWGVDETLQDINLSVQPGELMAIIGSVGSGKSSILSTFLGNMKKLSGDIELRGTVAYVSQEAWIQNATLRENILFGSAFHPERYQRVINCCQLTQDLDMLPAGDLTEIGEKGINLSGGQKQRVAMARAVYQNADIYLLDDPLSAVDAHVGRTIFEECICHVLQGKTRILVTHQLQFLNRVNKIAVLTNGRISEIGTYEQLMEDGDIFSGLIRDHVIEGDGDSKPSASSSSSSSSSSASTEIVDVPEAKPKEKKEAKLISTEEREIGEVRLDVYKLYIFALGGAFIVTSILLMMAFEQAGRVATDWWLSYWSDNNELHSTSFYLSIYTSIGAAAAAITLVRSLTLAMASFNSAKKVHERLLENIMRVPMAFFDTTPVGRILNRFSKDQYTIDDTLPRSMGMFLTTVFASLAIICVIGSVTPFFLTALLPLGYLYRAVQRYYIRSSREMKRLDSVSRSPIYAHFGETLAGVNTIRAFDKTGDFVNQNEKILDANQRAFFINNASNRWLGVRLEFVGTIVVTLSALFAVMERDNLDPGAAGLSLTYALQTTSLLNWLVRMYTDTESQMVSVERMEEYSTIEREAPPIIPSRRPPPGWPETGSITFENYKLRYRPGLDLVLKDISVKIQGGQKIGIVGRTGAGKSSLMLALFRLVEPAGGKILIDEVDISTMGLEDLRTKISIIPQDPTLFTGSVRSNLDPFSQYEDPQIWKTLEAVHLKDAVMALPEKLESAVAEFGGNFSVGQRQLMCLGRALLKSSRIIVMDEATASVDYQTDALIQQTMREEFRNCTVLTIAHRIKTILDYDKVLVLDQGYVAEYDSPEVLRRDPRTAFYSMVNKSGTAHVDE